MEEASVLYLSFVIERERREKASQILLSIIQPYVYTHSINTRNVHACHHVHTHAHMRLE